ncbi:hypothetical protein Cgig2_033099 [Carnegiea gigantea]|uniref:CCT domain-containing protein n=1 Tax=Carnegiea gigantea TaxID=171969 RepID=A0A9Q1GSA6_9CARY|nr:hypothetical protein Cgig2_033099 [Carnegiea gigantea]
MRFVSFLKVDLKQIPRKLLEWLVDTLILMLYASDFQMGKSFKSHHLMGRKIIEITKSLMDKEYDEVNVVWLKEWKINQNALELTRMLEFILANKDRGENFKRNFIIYLVNYLFNGSKSCYCNKSVLKYIKDMNQIASLDWCQFVLDKLINSVSQYKENKAAKEVHYPLFFFTMSSTVPTNYHLIGLVISIIAFTDFGGGHDVSVEVRYQSRKRLAKQRPRVKGQFVHQAPTDPVLTDVDKP